MTQSKPKTAPAAPKRDEEPVTNSRGLATQDKILEAAKTLLLKEGATKLTVSAVAKKAGVTPSAVRYHFGNADMVLGGLLCEYYDYAGTQIAERITVAKICLHRARGKLKAIDEYLDWWRSSRREDPQYEALGKALLGMSSTSETVRALEASWYEELASRMGRLSGTDLVCFLLAFRGYCSAKRLKEYVHVDEEHEELFDRLLEPR